MKKLTLTLLLALVCNFGYAQRQEPFRIDSLPKQGILLDKNWRWYAGDNPEFAKTDFDDSKWENIDPTKDIMSLPQLWKTEIVWFRLRFNSDSSLVDKSLVIQVKQTGASEIFLNGQFIEKFGEINTKTRQIQAATPINSSFIGLPIRKKGEQVLSVRFATQKNISYLMFAGRANVALVLKVLESSNTSLVIENDITRNFDFLRFGLYLILAILHFALFWFNKSQKANLYLFLYALLTTIGDLLIGLVYNQVHFASTKMFFLFTIAILAMVADMFFLTAVHSIFNRQRGIIYKILIVYLLISFVLLFVDYQNGFSFGASIFGILVPLESVRTTFLARRNKQRGSNIIIVGAVSYLTFLALFYLFVFRYLPAGPKWIYGHLAFNLSFLSLPIAISIYLALESAFASRTLKLKLVEVENLSAEKQQILATQNVTLERQVEERTVELNQSLTELKSTQAQLIQKEKLASLGELTAGIAHEIQNPLNFVNNFSEVSAELVQEIKEERQKPKENQDESLVDEIFNDISQNLEKITLHGKRASSIVKGMLEHSRTSTGVKELTDINQLADEYLRLSYHGIRAKDDNFSSDYQTDFDENLPKIEVIPQDMGRVLLNLINNAFWAVNEKSKKGEIGYEPKVTVNTKLIANSQLLLAIKDNGIGMNEEIKAKIFQPFFTTKPTGQGTGLGLSLAYDIVTKGHGGTLEVTSTEGVGSEFIITLPFKIN